MNYYELFIINFIYQYIFLSRNPELKSGAIPMNTLFVEPRTAAVAQPDARGVRRVDFRALGTACLIQFRHPGDRTASQYIAAALDWLTAFEGKYSRFRPDSIISRINAAAGREWVEVDGETERLLDLAADLHRVTEGILDPTMLPLLRVWDWKTVHVKLPDKGEIKAALALTGLGKVKRKPGQVFLPQSGMGLDFGGFGKEFAVDQLVRIAREHGIEDALIDLGRDLYAIGGNGQHPFWHVGLEDARHPGTCWGGLAVSDFGVASSGDGLRRFEVNGVRYGHILDPRTGWPVGNGLRGVSVIAPSCLQAGIYSTAIFVLGLKAGLRFAACARDVEVSVQTDHGTETTPGFIRRQVRAA
jgi:FAD:protein FMN transferase